jgi:hypothetical protein
VRVCQFRHTGVLSCLKQCRGPESNRYGSHLPQDFKSCASASSATPAKYNGYCLLKILEAATGFEPVVKVLQTSALPLGYAAEYYGAEDGIRTRDPHLGKVVFYH